MSIYVKDTPRITVKFINSDTDAIICEVKDRNWLSVGELFPSTTVTGIIKQEFKNKRLPKNILVIAVSEYTLDDEH